ncbi:acylphosphatase [Candidatus Parcubacteria bacterium]|nr:acylphosphatase [Candidatus Parcubacteria bacterium]
MNKKIRVHLFISGRVQGVFFRENTRRKAEKLELNGWVRNLPDGRVEIILEGDEEKVKKMIKWTKKGPIIAKVDEVEIEEKEYENEFKDFKIEY